MTRTRPDQCRQRWPALFRSPCDFTASLDLSQPTISHHIGKLREARLVDAEKHGIWIYYRLSDNLPNSTRQVLSQLVA